MENLNNDVTLLKIANNLSQVADDNYLPNGTIIYVNADGSGDFASLNEACAYVNTKCCPGIVTIQLSEGNFNLINSVVFELTCNLSKLCIQGQGEDKTTITYTKNSADCIINASETTLIIKNLTLISLYKNGGGIYIHNNNTLYIGNVTIDNFNCGIICDMGITIINSPLTIKNCNIGLRTSGSFIFGYNTTIAFNNISDTALVVWWHGTIDLMGCTISQSNVHSISSIERNVTHKDGYINWMYN